MKHELIQLFEQWQAWASSANQSENGWQSDFPNWNQLISAACETMASFATQQECLTQIDLCWKISEETEDLADFAKEHLTECWRVLQLLTKSNYPEVRWQVYSVLAAAGARAESLLRTAIDDPDSYCQRRAILALASIHPSDAAELQARFIQNSDPHICQAAKAFHN